MSAAAETLSGKGHRDENFPVASWLISEKPRRAILAFYRFARAADDIADHEGLEPQAKLARLDAFEAALIGQGRDSEAEPLRLALAEEGLESVHARELLAAFRQDATKTRYASWDELMAYCRLSAAPVGRFVLDAHGESRALWPASDALCAALQINNHLQDCAKDYRGLDRVYLPADVLARHGAAIDMLTEPRSPAPLRSAIFELAQRSEALIDEAVSLAPAIADRRLSLEIAGIAALARRIARRLQQADPLSERVHLGKWELFGVAAGAAIRALPAVLRRRGRAA